MALNACLQAIVQPPNGELDDTYYEKLIEVAGHLLTHPESVLDAAHLQILTDGLTHMDENVVNAIIRVIGLAASNPHHFPTVAQTPALLEQAVHVTLFPLTEDLNPIDSARKHASLVASYLLCIHHPGVEWLLNLADARGVVLLQSIFHDFLDRSRPVALGACKLLVRLIGDGESTMARLSGDTTSELSLADRLRSCCHPKLSSVAEKLSVLDLNILLLNERQESAVNLLQNAHLIQDLLRLLDDPDRLVSGRAMDFVVTLSRHNIGADLWNDIVPGIESLLTSESFAAVSAGLSSLGHVVASTKIPFIVSTRLLGHAIALTKHLMGAPVEGTLNFSANIAAHRDADRLLCQALGALRLLVTVQHSVVVETACAILRRPNDERNSRHASTRAVTSALDVLKVAATHPPIEASVAEYAGVCRDCLYVAATTNSTAVLPAAFDVVLQFLRHPSGAHLSWLEAPEIATAAKQRCVDPRWENRDSAVGFITGLLDVRRGDDAVGEVYVASQGLGGALLARLADSEGFVRAAALKSVSRMATSPGLWQVLLQNRPTLLADVVAFSADDETFARRAAWECYCHLLELPHTRPALTADIVELATHVEAILQDFDWENRICCVRLLGCLAHEHAAITDTANFLNGLQLIASLPFVPLLQRLLEDEIRLVRRDISIFLQSLLVKCEQLGILDPASRTVVAGSLPGTPEGAAVGALIGHVAGLPLGEVAADCQVDAVYDEFEIAVSGPPEKVQTMDCY